MTDIEIDLPLPISANMIWRSDRGRVHLSKAYQNWIKAADQLVRAQKIGWRFKKITGKFTVVLILNESKMRQDSDGDNKLKVPLDYAKRLGLIVDDSIKYCRDWRIKLGDDSNAPEGARLIIRSTD